MLRALGCFGRKSNFIAVQLGFREQQRQPLWAVHFRTTPALVVSICGGSLGHLGNCRLLFADATPHTQAFAIIW